MINEFLHYCKEKKIYPKTLIENEQWRKSVEDLFRSSRRWYHDGGKEVYDAYLQQGKSNIIIVEGHTYAPPPKNNCPDCGKEELEEKEIQITKFIEEKIKNAGPKRRK